MSLRQSRRASNTCLPPAPTECPGVAESVSLGFGQLTELAVWAVTAGAETGEPPTPWIRVASCLLPLT
jgi:hypothetical protein